MAVNIKQLSNKPDLLTGGHRACAGCTGPSIIRQALLTADTPVVCGCATGCMEVVTTIFPYTAWKVPFIHNAFENSAATMSGVEAAYQSLKRQGKITKDIRFIAWGGDGGTYDIGFQSLSGAMERGHRMLYICYDNEGYMNTGIQRSGSTPIGTATTTTPVGKKIVGKQQYNKDLTLIMIAHNVPFVAQASVHNFRDFMEKVQKALAVEGPSFINVLSPCNRGWRVKIEDSVAVARVATETCFWPLFEVENGKWKLNYKPKEKKPITEWLQMQGRFSHLFKPQNQHIVEKMQAEVDRRWNELLARCEQK
ncbi:MAG: thiamine pyrophosphate-dependent enzyme [bacterium]|nr:thiamine pyrophosphate-dependent enzyme [bacterium]